MVLDEFNEVTKDINNADEAILAWKNHVGQTSEATTFESVWSSTSDEVKKKLLDLAKSGEITPETLSSTKEYNELLEKTGISAENAKDQILDMLSVQERLSGATQGLNKLKSAYEEFKNKDIGFVTAETLESLPDVFKNLPEFNSFSKIAGNPESGTEKIQQAFNDIVKAYILDQETLQGLEHLHISGIKMEIWSKIKRIARILYRVQILQTVQNIYVRFLMRMVLLLVLLLYQKQEKTLQLVLMLLLILKMAIYGMTLKINY